MTGFGRSEYSDENRRIIIEIKSVNHRYCDVSIKLPRIISRFEPELRKRIKLYAERGKIDIFVTYNNLKSSGYMVKYDKEVLQQYMDHFKTIEKDFGLEEEYKPTVVARFPDVLTVEEDYFVEDEEYEIIEKVFDEAGKQFMESRMNEGARLSADIVDKMAELESLTCQVDELAPKMIEEFRTKLTEKVEKLLEATDIDDSRIVQEVTIYSDKVAVDEELVRLHSHIAAVREMLAENEEGADSDKAQEKNSSIGRRLDFIVQEMNREANTTLSKSDTLAVTDIGIDMKTCIEKVREQVQNIE
ncbi:MAG: YicC family protein [Eubacterium sp.]|nr:YicC family protein [Eubacterium sp.]